MSILDYSKSVTERHYAGYASISFRQNNDPAYDIHRVFVLNSHNDGWFRRDKQSGIMSGVGIAINSIKITSRNPQYLGNYVAHKCKIDYINNEEEQTSDIFWLYVHKNFTLEEVIKYIEDNQENWYP